MRELPADPIGAAWLAKAYRIETMGRLPVVSQVWSQTLPSMGTIRLDPSGDILR